MSASRFIKCVTVGDDAVGKTCMLISFTSNNFPMALVDAPNIVRGQMNFKRISLTDIKIEIFRIPKKKSLFAAMEAADVKNKWENNSWGRTLIVQKRRDSLNDFDRLKVMLARIKKGKPHKLLEEGNSMLFDEKFYQELTDQFNHIGARSKALKVEVEQVRRWFSSRKRDHVREADSLPTKSMKLASVSESSPKGTKEFVTSPESLTGSSKGLIVAPETKISNNSPVETSSNMSKGALTRHIQLTVIGIFSCYVMKLCYE